MRMNRSLAAVLFLLLASVPSAEAQVRVTIAPPAPRVEVRPVQPSPRHVWAPGYWHWRGGRHAWVGGRFVMPPAPGRTWVEARWVNEGGQWVFYDGRWDGGGVVVQPAPPPRQVVVVHPAPPPRQVIVVQPAPPPPRVIEVEHGRGHGHGKGWKGKGKGWKHGRDWR